MGYRRIAGAKVSLPFAAALMVCSFAFPAAAQSPLMPDGDQYAAKALQVTGRVSVLRDATEYAIVEGGEVRAKELIFTGPDGSARFQVSDGSTFDVYPNSRVVFRKNVPNWRDLLDVLVGRVKVHIQHWGTEPNHNRVLTPTAVISVRGTTFDISVDDEDETTLVEVEEGVVEVQHALLPRGNAATLTAGESIRVYRNEPIASNRFDKGDFAKRVVRTVVDALSTWESKVPRGGVGGSSGGSTGGGSSSGSGDSGKPGPPTTGPGGPGTGPPPGSGGFTAGGPVVFSNGHTYGSHRGLQPETRLHKAGRVAWNMLVRFALGASPDEAVIRAVGGH
jgi:FecR protein